MFLLLAFFPTLSVGGDTERYNFKGSMLMQRDLIKSAGPGSNSHFPTENLILLTATCCSLWHKRFIPTSSLIAENLCHKLRKHLLENVQVNRNNSLLLIQESGQTSICKSHKILTSRRDDHYLKSSFSKIDCYQFSENVGVVIRSTNIQVYSLWFCLPEIECVYGTCIGIEIENLLIIK